MNARVRTTAVKKRLLPAGKFLFGKSRRRAPDLSGTELVDATVVAPGYDQGWRCCCRKSGHEFVVERAKIDLRIANGKPLGCPDCEAGK